MTYYERYKEALAWLAHTGCFDGVTGRYHGLLMDEIEMIAGELDCDIEEACAYLDRREA